MVIPVSFFLDLLNLQIIMQCVDGPFETINVFFELGILLCKISIFLLENLVLWELGFQYLVEVNTLVATY